jgi:hypothetical protein
MLVARSQGDLMFLISLLAACLTSPYASTASSSSHWTDGPPTGEAADAEAGLPDLSTAVNVDVADDTGHHDSPTIQEWADDTGHHGSKAF